jgi:hypothetical protein
VRNNQFESYRPLLGPLLQATKIVKAGEVIHVAA